MNVSIDEIGESVIGWAQLGNLKLVKTWSERARMDLDFQSESGVTALIAAVENGQYEVAEYLLKAGANPNVADSDGVTPLHYAILHIEDVDYDTSKFINLLIEAKADVNAQTNNGKTPLHLACQLKEIGICRILILNEADCFIRDKRGYFPHSIELCGRDFHEQFLDKFRVVVGKRILEIKKQFNYVITSSIESGVFTEASLFSDILNFPTSDDTSSPMDMRDTPAQAISKDFMSISPYKLNNNVATQPKRTQLQQPPQQQQHQLPPQKQQQQQNSMFKVPSLLRATDFSIGSSMAGRDAGVTHVIDDDANDANVSVEEQHLLQVKQKAMQAMYKSPLKSKLTELPNSAKKQQQSASTENLPLNEYLQQSNRQQNQKLANNSKTVPQPDSPSRLASQQSATVANGKASESPTADQRKGKKTTNEESMGFIQPTSDNEWTENGETPRMKKILRVSESPLK
jgi:hypothetical protein